MIIIYKEVKNGKIELTKKELEDLLEKARQEGYNQGYKDGVTAPTRIYYTGTPYTTPDYTKITCDGTTRLL